MLGYIEGKTSAIYHAASSLLLRVDRIQAHFLKCVDVTDVDALCKFRLAPLIARRDMAMLAIYTARSLVAALRSSRSFLNWMQQREIQLDANVNGDTIDNYFHIGREIFSRSLRTQFLVWWTCTICSQGILLNRIRYRDSTRSCKNI